MLGPEVPPEPVVGNAIAVVPPALLPGTVVGVPAFRAMLSPGTFLDALLLLCALWWLVGPLLFVSLLLLGVLVFLLHLVLVLACWLSVPGMLFFPLSVRLFLLCLFLFLLCVLLFFLSRLFLLRFFIFLLRVVALLAVFFLLRVSGSCGSQGQRQNCCTDNSY